MIKIQNIDFYQANFLLSHVFPSGPNLTGLNREHGERAHEKHNDVSGGGFELSGWRIDRSIEIVAMAHGVKLIYERAYKKYGSVHRNSGFRIFVVAHEN
jgi:hypothetical protein